MQIGELARSTGVGIETIRFYERERLLPQAARSRGNYRLFSVDHVERILFIRHCRSLDMNLDQIRILLGVRDTPKQSCDSVNALLDEKISEVHARISELKQLDVLLKQLRGRCENPATAQTCGILASLDAASSQESINA